MSLASMATSHAYKEHDDRKPRCRYGQQSTLTRKEQLGTLMAVLLESYVDSEIQSHP